MVLSFGYHSELVARGGVVFNIILGTMTAQIGHGDYVLLMLFGCCLGLSGREGAFDVVFGGSIEYHRI